MAKNRGTNVVVGERPPAEVPDGAPSGAQGPSAVTAPESPKPGEQTAVQAYGEYAGAGMEDIKREEILVPMYRILQTNSPQCADPADGGMEGMRAGMVINMALQEAYDVKRQPFLFVPCFRDHNYVEFVPRDAGGGFVGIWQPDDPRIEPLKKAQGRFGKLKLESGNELTETWYLYGLIKAGAEDWMQAVIPFTSTQIKKYQLIVTRINSLMGNPPKYPIFAFRWKGSTVGEKNKKGAFQGWRLGLDKDPDAPSDAARLAPDDGVLRQAAEFYKLLKSGGARADYQQAGDDEEDASGGPSGTGSDDDIPM